MTREFIIAKNPDRFSKLPYLLHLPLDGGPIWLKAKEMWPRAARVFCQRVDTPPGNVDVVERIDVTFCKRRGAAIDLVLSRGLNKRSQFIFAASNGRTLIFWQTPKTAAASRPGLRVPTGRLRTVPTIYVDSRERYGYTFSSHSAVIERRPLLVGDYAAILQDRIIALVERKAIEDFVSSLSDGSLMFAMAELCTAPVAAIAVEGKYSSLLRHRFTAKAFLADLLVRLQIRYPQIPIQFLETRKLAEDWTYRFLGCAYDNASTMLLPFGANESRGTRDGV